MTTGSTSGPPFNATGLNPSTNYQARVRSVNSVGASAWSPWTTFTTTAQPAGLMPTNATQAQIDSKIASQYDAWMAANYITKSPEGWGAIRAEAQGNMIVSEGMGYGLMITAMIQHDPAAQSKFDAMIAHCLAHPSYIDPDLLAWGQNTSWVNSDGANSTDCATDGDMDIARALLIAWARWGANGTTYNYRSLARTKIAAIKRSLISSSNGLLRLGDWSSGATTGNDNTSRPSDWMIGHFEAFEKEIGDGYWLTKRDQHLDAIEYVQSALASSTGLLPDFVTGATRSTLTAGPANVLEGATDDDYSWNSCRVPWRLGASSSSRAQAAAKKISDWAYTKTSGAPASFNGGYTLAGVALSPVGNERAFTGALPLAAKWGSNQAWLNSLYTYYTGTNSDYFSGAIELLTWIQGFSSFGSI